MAEGAFGGALRRLARPGAASRSDARTKAAWLLGLVCVAEAIFLVLGLLAGAVAGLVAVSILLAYGSARVDRPEGQAAVALSVVPLLRVLSIALPSFLVPVWIWHAEIGIAVIVATLLASRLIGIGPTDLGLRTVPERDTVLAALAGLPLGFLASRIAETSSILPDRALTTVVVASLAVIIGAAFAEELLFRGLLLRVAERAGGGDGVLVSSALSTLFYVGTLNIRYVVLMGLVSIVFATVTRRSGSIWPAVACHAVMAWSQLILWPALAG